MSKAKPKDKKNDASSQYFINSYIGYKSKLKCKRDQ